MQLSYVTVRLGGSLMHTVFKKDVTPAEILVLSRIHGDGSVVDIRPTEYDKKRTQNGEFDRLARLYDRRRGISAGPDDKGNSGLLNEMFPGAMKKLPLTLGDIGMPELDPVDEKPKRKSKKKADEPKAEEQPSDEPEGAEDGIITVETTEGADAPNEGE